MENERTEMCVMKYSSLTLCMFVHSMHNCQKTHHVIQIQLGLVCFTSHCHVIVPISALRKILRLVKHTLTTVSGVRDQEMALLDEMLAACAREASNKSLELIFSSHLFYQNRQERFVRSLAGTNPHLYSG